MAVGGFVTEFDVDVEFCQKRSRRMWREWGFASRINGENVRTKGEMVDFKGINARFKRTLELVKRLKSANGAHFRLHFARQRSAFDEFDAIVASSAGNIAVRWLSMAKITIRNLDDQVKRSLQVRAARNGRSMEAEALAILTVIVNSISENAGREMCRNLPGPQRRGTGATRR